jgi:hypothetical protein
VGNITLEVMLARVETVLSAEYLDGAARVLDGLPYSAGTAGETRTTRRAGKRHAQAAETAARLAADRGAIPRPEHRSGHAGLGGSGDVGPSLRSGAAALIRQTVSAGYGRTLLISACGTD